MGVPPALGCDEMLHDRRPDRAAEIIAARDDGDGNAAAPGEPLRSVGDQRPERGGGAEPDEDVHERKQHETVGEARGNVTGAEGERAADHRRGDAEPVGEPPHHHAAAGKSDHRQRKRQRSIRAGDPELGLHRGQHDRHRPHANAADGAEHHGGDEPQPGEGGFDPGVKSCKSQHCWTFFPALLSRRLVEAFFGKGRGSSNPNQDIKSSAPAHGCCAVTMAVGLFESHLVGTPPRPEDRQRHARSARKQ